MLLTGKTLVSCETAIQAFRNIVDNLAGPNELARANALLARVTMVSDDPSQRAQSKLSQNGKVKPRSIVIFGTGDQMKAVTTTANDGFLRAAKNQVNPFFSWTGGSFNRVRVIIS